MKKMFLTLSILACTTNFASEASDWSSAWTAENFKLQGEASSSENGGFATSCQPGQYRSCGDAMSSNAVLLFAGYPIMSTLVVPTIASTDPKQRIAGKMDTAKQKRAIEDAQKQTANQKQKFQRQIPVIRQTLESMFIKSGLYLSNGIPDADEVKALEKNFSRLAYNLTNNKAIVDDTIVPADIEAMIKSKIKTTLVKENAEDLEVEVNQAFAMKLYCRLLIAYLDSIREKTEVEQNLLLK